MSPFNAVRNALIVKHQKWDFTVPDSVLAQLERCVVTADKIDKKAINDLVKLASVQLGGADLIDYCIPLVMESLSKGYQATKLIQSLLDSNLVNNINKVKDGQYHRAKTLFERIKATLFNVFSFHKEDEH